MWGAKPPTPPMFFVRPPTLFAAALRNGVPKGVSPLRGVMRGGWGDGLSTGTLFSPAKLPLLLPTPSVLGDACPWGKKERGDER